MAKLTQADIDAGLTQADVDAGLRAGRNERISDEDRMVARVRAEKADPTSIVDMYRDYKTHPGAKAFPVTPPSNTDESSLLDEAPRRRTSNDAIGDLVRKLGSGRVGTIPPRYEPGAKKGGAVNKMAKGGSVKSGASKRGDGIAQRGKTKGRMV